MGMSDVSGINRDKVQDEKKKSENEKKPVEKLVG